MIISEKLVKASVLLLQAPSYCHSHTLFSFVGLLSLVDTLGGDKVSMLTHIPIQTAEED